MGPISQIEAVGRDLDGSVLVKVLQGEQLALQFDWADNGGTPIDVTNFAIDADGEFYMAQVSGDSVARMALDEAHAPRSLTVSKVPGITGRFSVLIPSDLYAGDIPANTGNPPVFAFWVKVSDGQPTPTIDEVRVLVIIRRGK